MVFIQAKHKCPTKSLNAPNASSNNQLNTKNDSTKCIGVFVYVARMAAFIWLVSLLYIVFMITATLLITLLSVSQFSEKNNKQLSNTCINMKAMLSYLNFFWHPAYTALVFLSCVFVVCYVICKIIEFIKPFLPIIIFWIPAVGYPLAVFIILFDPICCALWEIGVFTIIEKILNGEAFRNIFTLKNLRTMGSSENKTDDADLNLSDLREIYDASISNDANSLNKIGNIISKIMNNVSSNTKSPVTVNIDKDGSGSGSDSDTNDTSESESFNNKLKDIEYQNCIAGYKKNSSLEASAEYFMYKLHELKCYSQSLKPNVDTKVYNDGSCAQGKSIMAKGTESYSSVENHVVSNTKNVQQEASMASSRPSGTCETKCNAVCVVDGETKQIIESHCHKEEPKNIIRGGSESSDSKDSGGSGGGSSGGSGGGSDGGSGGDSGDSSKDKTTTSKEEKANEKKKEAVQTLNPVAKRKAFLQAKRARSQ